MVVQFIVHDYFYNYVYNAQDRYWPVILCISFFMMWYNSSIFEIFWYNTLIERINRVSVKHCNFFAASRTKRADILSSPGAFALLTFVSALMTSSVATISKQQELVVTLLFLHSWLM